MFKTIITALIVAGSAAIALFTPATAQSKRYTTPMLNSGEVISYGFRPYGSIVIASMVKDIGGKTAVCGFWAVQERLQAYVISTKLDLKARQKVTIKLGNRRLLTGVGFMNKVDLDDFEAGTKANCQVTAVPWQAGFATQEIEYNSPRLRVFE
ncbi:MAG: hypothetical protein AAFQ60_13110 [Pseudomonadota bacterium]